MKHFNMFGIFVMAVAALMAFASSASATVLTSPAGTEYTGTLKASATASLLLEASVFNATCTSSAVEGNVTTNTTSASGAVKSLTFTGCDSTVHVQELGSVEAKSGGEVRVIGHKVTVEKSGVSCVYGGGAGTKVGTGKGGTTASLTVSAVVPKQGGSFLCPSTAKVTGKYTVTTPDTLVGD